MKWKRRRDSGEMGKGQTPDNDLGCVRVKKSQKRPCGEPGLSVYANRCLYKET